MTAFAAQSAFFALLALVPFTTLLLTAAGSVLPDTAPSLLPPLLQDLIPSLTPPVGALTPLSALTALWAVSRGTAAIIGGLTRIDGRQAETGFVKTRVAALLYTLAFLLMLIPALFLLLFGNGLDRLFQQLLPSGGWLWLVLLRPLISVGFLTGLFLFMYRYLPAGKAVRSFRSLFPGAFLAALCWTVFSGVFSFYLASGADYSRLYGGLAAVATVMLWLYVCMLLVFLGAECNVFLRQD